MFCVICVGDSTVRVENMNFEDLSDETLIMNGPPVDKSRSMCLVAGMLEPDFSSTLNTGSRRDIWIPHTQVSLTERLGDVDMKYWCRNSFWCPPAY